MKYCRVHKVLVEGCTCPDSRREYTGRLDTDFWNNLMIDGFKVDFDNFEGCRVRIVIEVVGDDPESYENLAKSYENR